MDRFREVTRRPEQEQEEEQAEEQEEEEEEQEEEQEEQNEEPLLPVSPEFKNLVLLVKHKLYHCIIFGPQLETKKAQDNQLLIIYLKKLTSLNKLCNRIQSHQLNDTELIPLLRTYPLKTRQTIKQLIQWLIGFSNKNEYVDMIPYMDHMETQFHRHPLIQK